MILLYDKVSTLPPSFLSLKIHSATSHATSPLLFYTRPDRSGPHEPFPPRNHTCELSTHTARASCQHSTSLSQRSRFVFSNVGILWITFFFSLSISKVFRGVSNTVLLCFLASSDGRLNPGWKFYALDLSWSSQDTVDQVCHLSMWILWFYPHHYDEAFAFWPLSYPLIVTIIFGDSRRSLSFISGLCISIVALQWLLGLSCSTIDTIYIKP